MIHLRVAGTGRYLPDEVIPNSYFAGRDLRRYDSLGCIVGVVRKNESEIFKVTGIRERRKSPQGQTSADMGYEAASMAIERAGIDVDSLVGIIVGTVTEDVNFPSAACKIQERLGARNCFAYDISNACASFPEALAQANARVLRKHGNYLVVSAENMLGMVDSNDINSTLFGNGAGAAVLVPTEGPEGIVAEYSFSNPFDGGLNLIFRDPERFCRMPEGDLVFKRAVKSMITASESLKSDAKWDRADVYIPHQANGRIVDLVESKVREEGCVVFRTVEKYGNMSGATVAVALDEAIEQNVINSGKRVILVSFGSGLVTSGVAIQF
ncbi:MAG: ketoacyl-ACP synthase III [Candidatus Pacearchaeota archaeon]|nr:ketoacyl-ACP synthase III [Candidatus Pacearchaeota archaeon]